MLELWGGARVHAAGARVYASLVIIVSAPVQRIGFWGFSVLVRTFGSGLDNPILFIVISALSFSMNKKHNTWQTSPGGPDGAWRDNNLLRKNNCWEHLILLKSPLFNLLRN